jgi:16S rRNA (cytosine967-C5)-methyltransferase
VKRTPRESALAVFLAWEASRETADGLLGAQLAQDRLSGRDRDLAAELVRGVFRWRGRLDWQLAPFVDRPFDALDAPVRWILRLGLYQIDRLDRVPAHAAVDTSVELAKRAAGGGAAGLVNAVLRRAARDVADLVEPDAAEAPLDHLVARTSHPRWLLERWLARWGFRKTLALAAAGNRKPSLTLRVVSDRVDAAGVLADLRARGIHATPGVLLPDCVVLAEGWHPAVREWIENGLCVVQDEAAGLAAYVARPTRGARVLDVCAGLGGKALHFAELCGEAEVVACDVSVRRLAALRGAAERVRTPGVTFRLVACDGTRPATRGGFARVLVDAPCTNTGVLGRRADARWRKQPEDLPRLAALQGALLDASRAQTGPGGLVVYSTCSLEPEENEDVIAAYLARHPSDALLPADDVLPPELVDRGCLRTDPADHGVDGAFAAAIRVGGRALAVIS